MDVVLSAGSTPGKIDPLLEYTHVERKALIPIGEKPMIKWVTDALIGSHHVDRLIIVGLDQSTKIDFGSKPVIFVPQRGSLMQNYIAGVERALQDTADSRRILIATCDIPFITTAIVDEHIDAILATDDDVYYSIVSKATMLAKFPTSKRSYTRLRDGVFCGGNINMISAKVMSSESRSIWDQLLERRKNVFQQAALAGYGTLLKLLSGRLTIAAAEQRAGKIMGVKCKAIETPYAEIGMDVDKPFQLEIAKVELNNREAS
jgi:GTP:adenosylcobinamide-phosphate guanylyltransferase